MMRIFLTCLNCLLLTACFTTRLEAPPGKDVRIMAAEERATFHKEYKDWYLFSGLLPISRTNIAELIAKERLAEVRVETEDRVADGVITLVTQELLLGLFPQTIVIEGNTVSPRNIVIEDTTERFGQPKNERLTRHAEPSGHPSGQAKDQQPGTPLSGTAGRPASGIPVNAPLP
jgi:hypothetical protein